MIRKTATVGDWIIGTGSKTKQRDGYLVYAMRVTEIMSFDEYWNDPRFRDKRPSMYASRKKLSGTTFITRILSQTNGAK